MTKKTTRKKRKKITSPTPAKPKPLQIGRLSRQCIPVNQIKRAPYNPRIDLTPEMPEYEAIKRSFEEFGYVTSMTLNGRTGNLVGGHQRLKILVDEFGVTEVDVDVVYLSLSDEKLLNIALNKTGGDWDTQALAELLGELKAADADVSLTGFDEDAIAKLLKSLKGDEPDTSPQLGDFEYRVIVDCADEDHQRKMLVRLKKEGLTCRPLMS